VLAQVLADAMKAAPQRRHRDVLVGRDLRERVAVGEAPGPAQGGRVDAPNAVDTAEASLKQVPAKQKAARKTANATRLALKTYIVGTAGAGAVQMLEDFGFPAPKPKGKKTVAAKATAIAKSAATCTARHTMGKRQRAAIKATVAPATAPAAPATAPTAPAGTTTK
jgi:hypothetical protein